MDSEPGLKRLIDHWMESYRALKLQQSPNLRQALKDAMRDSTVLLGVAAGIPSIATARILAATPADWCWVDAEHTPMSPTLMADMVQTVNMYSEGKMAAVVRVPTHGHEWIAWALDAGAAGVMIPHTETVEQVKASIAAARFGPLGHRSFPPFAMLPGLTDLAPEGMNWMDVANEHIAVIPQIESMAGVENLEEIIQLEGVDGIMIGKGDLQMDMGLPLQAISSHPAFVEVMQRVYALARKYNKPLVGVVRGPEMEESVKGGYRMVAEISDFHAIGLGVTMSLNQSRAAALKATQSLTHVSAGVA